MLSAMYVLEERIISILYNYAICIALRTTYIYIGAMDTTRTIAPLRIVLAAITTLSRWSSCTSCGPLPNFLLIQTSLLKDLFHLL